MDTLTAPDRSRSRARTPLGFGIAALLSLGVIASPAVAAEPVAAPADVTEAPKPSLRESAATAKITVTPWVMLITNAVYNTGTGTASAEAPTGAKLGSGHDKLPTDGNFLMSARQSRLGVKGAIDTESGWTLAGRLETDFFGLSETHGSTAMPMSAPRLRIASFDIGTGGLRFLIGQDWLIFTPRLPTSISHSAVPLHSSAGVLWGRLPQATVRYDAPVGSLSLRTALSVVRPHSGDGATGIGRADELEPGMQSRLPFVQGRVAIGSTDKPQTFEVGIAGHWGTETWDVPDGSTTRREDVPTWLASFDAVGRAQGFTLQGQAWMGENLNGLFGRQGVRKVTMLPEGQTSPVLTGVEPLPSFGGWAELAAPTGVTGLTLVLSGGAELGEEDEVAVGAAWRTIGYFGALQYAATDWLQFSGEFLRSTTWYRPDTSHRSAPGFDPANDPGVPDEARYGVNNSISLNSRFSF